MFGYGVANVGNTHFCSSTGENSEEGGLRRFDSCPSSHSASRVKTTARSRAGGRSRDWSRLLPLPHLRLAPVQGEPGEGVGCIKRGVSGQAGPPSVQ